MEKKIPYISRNYDDYRQALIDLSKKYYPELDFNFDDASVGSWFLDLNAVIADELSYHVDRAYQETNINSAMKTSSLFTLARNMGFKVPGPKGAMCEVAFKCIIPPERDGSTVKGPDFKNYGPIIKKGTKVSSGSQTFELLDELVFAHQFNYDGVSDRLIQPIRNSNSEIISYQVTKFAVVIAGESNIYKKYISSDDVVPFMEILLPAENVMNVESIIVKEGSSFQDNPTIAEFYMPEETTSTTTNIRFFEVDSLSQQYMWDAVYGVDGKPDIYEYHPSGSTETVYCVTKGVWKNVKHKFVTEYTDNGYLKVTFGAGLEGDTEPRNASTFAEYQITKMMRNNSLGVLPKADTTVFIRYRSGGGKASNLPKGAINTISYLNAEILDSGSQNKPDNYEVVRGRVLASISVESTMESVSGKDMPTSDELRNMMKYYTGAQQRCVTLKDYESRVMQMPAKYGCPFRVGAVEQNNKVMLYLLGVNNKGYLDKSLPLAMVENIQKYLSKYRMVNDLVEIKPGKIINLRFDVKVIIDKDYNACDVITAIKNTITNYMDVRKHDMGEDIFVGDISKEISKVDGVMNLVKLSVFNKHDNGYSSDRTEQDLVTGCDSNNTDYCDEIDLEASDMMLYSVGNMCMFEVKNPDKDINIEYKQK